MNQRQQDWIDNASYEDLLRKARFAPIGDPYFQGELGSYFMTAMMLRRANLPPGEHTTTSKRVGWDA